MLNPKIAASRAIGYRLVNGYDVVLSPNGTFFAAICGNTIEVFDLKTIVNVATLGRHVARRDIGASKAGTPVEVSRALFSPDGKYLATGGGDGCVRLWSVPQFEEVACWNQHADRLDSYTRNKITGLAFTSDSKTVVSAADDGQVVIWDVKTGHLIRTIQVHPFPGTAGVEEPGKIDLRTTPVIIAISPDASRLATADAGRVALWDLSSGTLLAEDRKNLPSLSCLAFSPDGSELSAPGHSRGIVRWDVKSAPARLQKK